MKFNELNVTTQIKPKRKGRGIASGAGKTAGRGTKGQKSRTGSTSKPGFAGGQNPIMQALPKLPGFRSRRLKAENVYTSDLELLKVKVIDATTLVEHKLVSSQFVRIKLLTKGELKSALTIKLPGASQSAIDAVQKAGGSFEKVAIMQRAKREKPKTD
jgi:large subunit ribosomal protein L15